MKQGNSETRKQGNSISVFISRDLSGTSTFLKRLTGAGYRVTGQSLIEFRAVPFDEVPKTDWIFFNSPRGVNFFLEGLQRIRLPIPQEVDIAVMGKGTAEALIKNGLAPAFSGTGKPESTAAAFLKAARNCRVLFPQARRSRRSIQKALGNEIKAIDLIVYDNQPGKNVPQNDFDVLVFTSPLNAEAFFRANTFKPGQKVIAIGGPTAEALAGLKIAPVQIAPFPTEEALAELALK